MDLKVARRSATLRGQVEDKIRSAIHQGQFKPGQRLVERELCELLDVSRTSVREALRHLEAENLVVLVPHRGPMVAMMSLEEAKQLYELRELLEGYAGEQFALVGTDEQKAKLDGAIAEFAGVANAGMSGTRLVTAKEAFYKVLAEGCGNAFVGQTLESLNNRVAVLRLASMSQPGRLHHSLEELRQIASAIVAGNSKEAGEACRRHIRNAATAALEYFRPTTD